MSEHKCGKCGAGMPCEQTETTLRRAYADLRLAQLGREAAVDREAVMQRRLATTEAEFEAYRNEREPKYRMRAERAETMAATITAAMNDLLQINGLLQKERDLAEAALLKYTQEYSSEMEIARQYEPKLAAIEKASRSLLKLIGKGPAGITPDTEGTYNQRVLALFVALGEE